MSEHLSAQQVESYQRRSMSPLERFIADQHLGLCPACRQALGDPEQTSWNLSRAGPPGNGKTDHLDYHDLVRYVDGELDSPGLEKIKAHLEGCSSCASRISSLGSFKKAMAALPPRYHAPAAALTFWDRIAASWRSLAPARLTGPALPSAGASGPMRAPAAVPFRWIPITALGVTAAAALLFLMWYHSLARPAIDGISVISKSHRLDHPDLTARNGSDRAARLPGSLETSFHPLYPVAEIISTHRPTFRWTALPGSAAYSLHLFTLIETGQHSKEKQQWDSGPVTRTEWTPSIPLPAGEDFHWRVTAYLKDGTQKESPELSRPPVMFRVKVQ